MRAILYILLLLIPFQSLADDFETFLYIKCDEKINLFELEEKNIYDFSNAKSAENHPNYFSDFIDIKGECNIKGINITWEGKSSAYTLGSSVTAMGITVYANGIKYFENINLNEVHYIRISPYQGRIRVSAKRKARYEKPFKGGHDFPEPEDLPITNKYFINSVGYIFYSEDKIIQ